MIIKEIHHSEKFFKELRKLPKFIADLVVKKEEMFKENPLHPSLRLHALHGDFKGSYSISLNDKYRIIFKKKSGGDIVFISVGDHDIYKK